MRDGLGYLRVDGKLLVWPLGYNVLLENDDIWILDAQKQKIARVGDTVKVTGVGAYKRQIQHAIGEMLREVALFRSNQPILQADIRKRAAGHDQVIAPPRAI